MSQNLKLFTIITIILLTLSSILLGKSRKRFNYVGAKVCKRCHNESKILNQYRIWQRSPHANAVIILNSKKAKKIANSILLKNPSESFICLKCHTTGGGKSEITKNEGVGCESCHGPGSGYSQITNHVNFQYRKNGYLRAKKFGMYPILKYEETLKKREKLCMSCHKKERPCWPKNIEEIAKQKLTIQVIDKLQKGDVNINHSLRNY